jgi:dinuclear metal center YbgI/SA1388 family protein
MNVKEITEKINEMIPLKLALDWDNVGLLIGDLKRRVKKIILTIDGTGEVVAEAKRQKIDLIVSYHPVIWDGLKKITANGPEAVVYDLIKSDISVFSIHTALDIVSGGVNDALAEMIGIVDGKPIGDFVDKPEPNDYKLVVYVPVGSVQKVANAVFAAGAGWIGNYSHCSFNTQGTGTFLPLEGAKPYIGKKGTVEKVSEIRFETIVPAERLDSVVAAMKKVHPYEEPAFDVFKLYNDRRIFGLGRIGKLQKPLKVSEIITKVKKATGAKAVGIIGSDKKIIKTAAVCAGYCGKIINQIIAQKAELYLTGELKHHQALAASEAGLTCLCLSHSVSERFILKKLAKQLKKALTDVTITISKKDADPFIWKQI